MDVAALINPAAALVVAGGTFLATMLRSGRGEIRAVASALWALCRPGLCYDGTRAQIAHAVSDLRRYGIYRASSGIFDDAEMGDAMGALIRRRSVSALADVHARHKDLRDARSAKAVHFLEQAGDLAPIFGLAGTLLSLSQLAGDGVAPAALMSSVAMAVVTTLYGLLLAHLVIMPIAGLLERRSWMEEEKRERLIAWVAEQLADECPPVQTVPPEAATRRPVDKVVA
ncbi:MotA/TolQ/ExbB proton channel family protein [Croceicoccus sp. F390]|uniref:MotA/TolQ/ExbB proton channel family protein n=1 Tax=Croceicoccus esteveae TaxID=3075597 RepID=A0ABU2ZDM4_9SPHN|nr:MotA/TolQ/ExbB proton channel family protein [Croceicoccus sp. F390]MDT0574708.1 MotA/TolQ/ExbB proton channel family protein [Croceicoccus sp. F390]